MMIAITTRALPQVKHLTRYGPNKWFAKLHHSIVLLVFTCLCGLPAAAHADHSPVGPLLNDLSGWNQPENYSTLQTADIDGDGQREIIARGKDGLHVWQWTNGAWMEIPKLEALSNSNGWTDASQYQTILPARLQRGSEANDVIARSSDGIHVWRYSKTNESWSELGGSTTRPFANAASDADWTKPLYYNTIMTGDIDEDGVSELIARGKRGLEVYNWDENAQQWRALSQSGPLSDADGFDSDTSSLSVQFVTLGNHASYVVARAASGVELLKWHEGAWRTISADGPFANSAFGENPRAALSVRAQVDGRGCLWLFGIVPDRDAGASLVEVYRWNEDTQHWSRPSLIPLPGGGWDRPSQYLTLRAGDLQGKGEIEILARGADGMHIFEQRFGKGRYANDDSHPRWRHAQLIRELGDDHGYNLASSYYTLQTLPMKQGDDARATVLLGRSPRGVEIYHNVGGVLTQATPFPAWKNQNQSQAYATISQALTAGQSNDIRNSYDLAATGYSFWRQQEFNLRTDYQTPTKGFPSASDWAVVYQQLDIEFLYVAAARAWFANNVTVTNYIFDAASLQLTQVSNDESISSSAGGSGAEVGLNWANLAVQLAGQILSVLGQPEAAYVAGLIQDALQSAAQAVWNGSSNIQGAVDNIAVNLNQIQQQYTTKNANQVTAYVTDWGLLQQIGVGSIGQKPKYQWGQGTSIEEIAAAETHGAVGQLLWMYKTVANAGWHVWWCWPDQWPFGGCTANGQYPTEYIANEYDSSHLHLTAYVTIKANGHPYPDFSALARLTGEYGVPIADILTDCNGWDTDNAAPRELEPRGECPAVASSALSGSGLQATMASLAGLRDRLKLDTASGAVRRLPVLDAAIRYIDAHSKWTPDAYGGAPNTADTTRAKSRTPSRFVDKAVPIQYLSHFVGIARNLPSEMGQRDDAYASEAYEIMGALNDDAVALSRLGPGNN